MLTRLAWAVLLALVIIPQTARAQRKIDAAAIYAILEDSRKLWDAPGLAVAIVQGDEVYLKGIGRRELGKDDPVTPDTIFAYASLTKAFTATALGVLVDDGKANWDDLVRNYLDWFRLADPLADREVRLRDLLCHRTGLSRHDLLWYRAHCSLEETVRRMARLEPTAGFRSRYQYNNLAYIAAGMAIGKRAGMPWEEFVQKRLLTPLGMKNAVFTGAEARARKDHATPHRRDKDGKLTPVPWYPDEKQVRGSGSLKGGVSDLAAWMQMQLAGGVYNGTRIVSEEVLRETHTPQIVVTLNRDVAKMTEATQASYGLGWHIHDYRGKRVLEHGGSNDGFRGRLILVPESKLGIALLTNFEEAHMLSAAGHRLLDHLLGLKEKDWVAFYKSRPVEGEEKRPKPVRKPGTKPKRELSAYAGRYINPAYGVLAVKEDGKGLALAWGSFRLALPHYHHDTFEVKSDRIEDRRLQGELATFVLGADANVATVNFLGRTWRRVN